MKYTKERHTYYKIVASELGINPFSIIKAAFALMGIIPLLVLFYLVMGRHFLSRFFVGSSGLVAAIAVFISFFGFLYAYNLVSSMVKRLISYFYERKLAADIKTELTASITHDLKTPLSVIKTAIHNLLDGMAGPINKAQAELAQQCLKSIDRTIGFIDELLNISKTHFIRTNIRRKLVNFEQVVKNEINEISAIAKRNNQSLKYKIMTSDSSLWADERKLSRAVMNLLSNAVKYTPPRGRIDVILSSKKNSIGLAVINTGPGIPEDQLNKIFDKYERLDRSSRVEGTGLGLSIVRDIVEMHKGHLTIKSRPGKKTEFGMILPKDLRTETH